MPRNESDSTAPYWSAWIRYGLPVVAIATAIVLSFWIRRTLHDRAIRHAETDATSALEHAQFDEACRLAQQVLDDQPANPSALLIAARAAGAKFAWSDAFAFCDRLSAAEKRAAARQLFTLGESSVLSGHARRAEVCLRLTLHLNPQNLDAIFILAFVLGVEGRAWEAAPLARVLIEAGRYDAPQLQLVGATEEFYINKPQFVDLCRAAVPDDPLPLLALALNSRIDGDLAAAEKSLLQVTAHDPTLIEAQARWGRLLVDNHRDSLLRTWNQKLPAAADGHPEIWVTRGLYAQRHNQQQAAIHCFAQAARLDPNLLVAHLHLGRLLLDGGQPQLAAEFRIRAERLSELMVLLTTFKSNLDPLVLRRTAELCETLDRPREAVAWAELLLRSQPDTEWARDLTGRLRQQYADQPPWIRNEARLADRLELTQFPLPDWELLPDPMSNPTDKSPIAAVDIRFSEDAAQLGIHFQYFNAGESPENTLKMFEFTGGGLGVIDFDGDGWPDLYAAQGSRFPTDPEARVPKSSETSELFPVEPPVHLDRLFRNQGGTHFEDVTESSGIREARYSQGVTAGDFDQDGFPDLYVANIGPNRLYRNNGDGTFADVTEQAGLRDDDWTTSCVLADLNGDAWPDIYAVNYLTGPGIYSRVCGSATHPQACLPTNFEPQQDRIWMNLGDGRFEEQTGSALIPERSSGRGLGIVVAAIDRPNRPNLFVANDTDPNFWYVNKTETPGGRVQIEERGIVAGLAFDADGHAQACMGIAAGDVDRDGRLDFFVTNFYRESNTLYVQQPDMSFLDKTRTAGLREPSLLMLGFGAQFLDADADGWLDLAVTNGHVYNNSDRDEPWKMRPQFFRNSGGRFVETAANQLGRYFEGQFLGRALVNWDWNRDGRPDLAVSHLDAPLAVLTNRSVSPFHTLVLSLRGVESNREAIGAIVHVTAGPDHWMTTITAGDGYLASNDRRLIVGLGRQEIANEIVIYWPSGRVDSISNTRADQEVLVIEGKPVVPMRSLDITKTSP